MGQPAWHVWWPEILVWSRAPKEYLTSRWHANKRKFDPDGGSDVDAFEPDLRLPYTARFGQVAPLYNLAVRPRELYSGWVYVLALVDLPAEDRAVVNIVGWASPRCSSFPS